MFLQKQGLVAQLGAHHIRIVGVGSSNLLKSTKQKHHPLGGASVWYGICARRFERSNPTVRWTVGRRRLDDGETFVFISKGNENANESPQVQRQDPTGRSFIFDD